MIDKPPLGVVNSMYAPKVRGVIFLYGVFDMAVKTARTKITFECTECKNRNYNSFKNKKNDPDRLNINKYCPFCKKHTTHKETK